MIINVVDRTFFDKLNIQNLNFCTLFALLSVMNRSFEIHKTKKSNIFIIIIIMYIVFRFFNNYLF